MAALRDHTEEIFGAAQKLAEDLMDFHEVMHDAGLSVSDAFCMVITMERDLSRALDAAD